ncbi:MAG: hypothetical protein PPP58_05250 [Natronomonas sp.]
MPTCDYCESSFEDETAYLEHLAAEHEGELGPIDQRRVADIDTEDDGLPTGPIAIAGIVLVSAGVVIYVAFVAGSGGGTAAGEPSYNPNVHEHGTMAVVIDGAELDFTDPEFIRDDEYRTFHFHPGYDDFDTYIWHLHGEGVTLQWALGTIDIDVNDDGSELTYDGETYDATDDDTEISIEVNGRSVAPGDHLLDGVGPVEEAAAGGGDDVRITVTTG